MQADGRLAKDGTRRGIASIGTPKKRKKPTLMQEIQKEMNARFGIKNWHPVKQTAIWAQMVGQGYEAVDEKGKPIIDEDGNPVTVPPNLPAAATMMGNVMRYTQRVLAPLPVEADNDDDDDFERQQAAIRAVAEKLGKRLPAPEPKTGDDDEDD